MLYSLRGTLKAFQDHSLILEVGPAECRVAVSTHTRAVLPEIGSMIHLFIVLYWREDVGPELYGFATERERELFERLNSISGIGPKSAMGVLGVAKVEQLIAAINEGRSELLTRASGVGKKTAERVILELKGKLEVKGAPEMVSLMESDVELEETLVALGYSRSDAARAIAKIDPAVKGFKERLKAALKKRTGD